MLIKNADVDSFTGGELLKMVTEGWVGRVTKGIESTIAESFAEDQIIRPVVTRNEIQRRFRLCIKGFVIMRRELKYAVPRILDELPTYLRCELDGIPWNPREDDRSWLAGDRIVGEVDGGDLNGDLPEVTGTEICPEG